VPSIPPPSALASPLRTHRTGVDSRVRRRWQQRY
jgi:hypothetical protein